MLKKGFTLIELLIVIAVLGILAVAVLSAINPLEQLKKARDSRRKSDAAELLNAYERYFTTFGCYPWENLAGNCNGVATNPANAQVTASTFQSGGINLELLAKQEMKTQFSGRATVTDGSLFVTESTAASSLGQTSVCFEPESQSARGGGLGATQNVSNTSAATCSGAYNGSASGASCFVCVPQ